MRDVATTQTTDLAAWLLEQIDADEEWAREVERPDDNSSDLFHCWVTGSEGLVETGMVDISPARVLAECAMKRLLVEEFDSCGDLLKILALPYADRADYQPEWAPVG